MPATAIEAAVAARAPVVAEGRAARRRERYSAPPAQARRRPRTTRRVLASSRAGAARRQDRRLCAGLRGAWRRRRRSSSWNLPLGDDRQDLARRLHHPLAIPRRHRLGLCRERHGRQPDDASSPSPACCKATQRQPRGDRRRGGAEGHPGAGAVLGACLFRPATGTAAAPPNLIQAQRDFFGAHGFERIDEPGKEAHGPWAMG